MTGPTHTSADKPLPRLRQDLEIGDAPRGPAGERMWHVYDPLRHRYIAINHDTRRALETWRDHETVGALASALGALSDRRVDAQDIEHLATFFKQNGFLVDTDNDWKQRWKSVKAAEESVWKRAIHGYLFFRVPLIAPEPFLRQTYSFVAPLFLPRVQLAIAALGLIGLYLVSRQWEAFLAGANGLMTAVGLAQLGVVLLVVKVVHEFAHAYTAHRHGCRVPVMGVAFMMMAPVLYTDVSDAWRLTDRRRRLAIDAAGVTVELMLAFLATFLWAFLPDGDLRQVCFLVATSCWVMSIAINLNPFMRFDGYYIASELLGIENLQARAFEFGVWRLREVLFALGKPAPERLPPRLATTLTVYAWSVWCYRVVLFTGIALAVYAMFFKALGILLFVFEIAYFIAKPVATEAIGWWKLRAEIRRSRRLWTTMALAMALLAAVVVPWPTNVTAPGVLEAAGQSRLHAPRPAQVAEVAVVHGQSVRRGDVIVRLDAPDLHSERRLAKARLTATELRLARSGADSEDRRERQVLIGVRQSLLSRIRGLDRELAELVLRAPIDGVVAELGPALHAGRWVAVKDQIALVVDRTGTNTVSAYLHEKDLWRVDLGAAARFTPEDTTMARSHASLIWISSAGASRIEQVELTVAHGGSIEVRNEAGRLAPTTAVYALGLAVQGDAGQVPHRIRGTVHLSGRGESYLSAIWRHLLKVVVRESAA